MNGGFRFAGTMAVCVALTSVSRNDAQERRQIPQYRYGKLSIPAAAADERIAAEFSPEATRRYLELGASLWSQQKKCVSCHTHGIYAMTRPALSPYWGRPQPELRDFIVSQAQEAMAGRKTNASTPAQLAYIARGLAEWDAQFGDTTSSDTDAVLRHLLSLPSADGSVRTQYRWPPLNSDSWHSTTMAAMAVATAPGWRAKLDDEILLTRIRKLEDYLRQMPPQHDHQRLLLLWASARRPELLEDKRRDEFVRMIWNQQRDDGGWSIRTFATPEELRGGPRAAKLQAELDLQKPASDGYQTGLVVVVLREVGVSAKDPRIQKAVNWLLSNQRESGRWWTHSLNVDSRFHYITYSGTAYAALALAKCGVLGEPGKD